MTHRPKGDEPWVLCFSPILRVVNLYHIYTDSECVYLPPTFKFALRLMVRIYSRMLTVVTSQLHKCIEIINFEIGATDAQEDLLLDTPDT